LKSLNLLKFTFVFFILAALFKFQNSTYANWHTHKLSQGYYIIHAHPYTPDNTSKIPFSKHPNTQKDLLRFEQFSFFFSLIGLFVFSFNVFQFAPQFISIHLFSFISHFKLSLFKNRAPPVPC
jgi:hypothetical protein